MIYKQNLKWKIYMCILLPKWYKNKDNLHTQFLEYIQNCDVKHMSFFQYHLAPSHIWYEADKTMIYGTKKAKASVTPWGYRDRLGKLWATGENWYV